MPIPARVKIGPYWYDVEIVPNLRDENDEGLQGRIWYHPQRIAINADLAPMRRAVTLMHESLHGMNDIARMGLTEKQIRRLAPLLVAFLVDNGYVEVQADVATAPVSKIDEPGDGS